MLVKFVIFIRSGSPSRRKVLKKNLFVQVVLIFLSVSPALSGDTYTIAVLPQYTPVQMYQMLMPLAGYLKKNAGISLKIKPYSSFNAFIKGVMGGGVDISYQDASVTLKVEPSMEPVVVAVRTHGTRTRGIIVVPKGSNVRHLKDLKGKKVVVVSFMSAGGFLSQGITLAKNGLNPFAYTDTYEAVRNCQENVILDVSMGNAAVGFLEEDVGKTLIQKLSAQDSIKILGYTAWVPQWNISVRSNLPRGVKIALSHGCLKMKKTDELNRNKKLTI